MLLANPLSSHEYMVWVAFDSQTGIPLGDQVAAYESVKDDLTRAWRHYFDSIDHYLHELDIQWNSRTFNGTRARSRSPPRQRRVLEEGQSLHYDFGQVSVIYCVSSIGRAGACCTVRKRYLSGDGGILWTRGYYNKTKQEHCFRNTFTISRP